MIIIYFIFYFFFLSFFFYLRRSKTPRPEHLIVKLKAPSGANNAKVILVRQPKGPDGTKGFNETKQQVTSDY